MQYFTLPHILRRTPVDSTSKLPNTSFWTKPLPRVRVRVRVRVQVSVRVRFRG